MSPMAHRPSRGPHPLVGRDRPGRAGPGRPCPAPGRRGRSGVRPRPAACRRAGCSSADGEPRTACRRGRPARPSRRRAPGCPRPGNIRRPARWPPAPRTTSSRGAPRDGHARSEAGERLRHLGADRPAAEHDQRARQLGGLRRRPGWSSTACPPDPRSAGRPARSRCSARRPCGPRRSGSLGTCTVTSLAPVIVPRAAHERGRPCDEPVDGHLVVPVVGRLVPDPGVHRRPVRGDRRASRPGRAPAGPRP